MQQSDIEKIAAQLADNRNHGRQSDLPLDRIRTPAEAEAIQRVALQAHDRDFKGYAMIGTSEMCRRTLGLAEPVFTKIPSRDRLHNESCIRLPEGVIGVQCELALMVGVLNETNDRRAERDHLATAILACMPTIGLLGRRAHIGGDPQLSAIADFGLHVATVSGAAMSDFDIRELDRVKIVARFDGKTAISFTGASTGIHPLDAVLWLKYELARRGSYISATDIVTTGSFGPILQVLPGQHFSVEWGDLGAVSCWQFRAGIRSAEALIAPG